jgi:hypothetical protein
MQGLIVLLKYVGYNELMYVGKLDESTTPGLYDIEDWNRRPHVYKNTQMHNDSVDIPTFRILEVHQQDNPIPSTSNTSDETVEKTCEASPYGVQLQTVVEFVRRAHMSRTRWMNAVNIELINKYMHRQTTYAKQDAANEHHTAGDTRDRTWERLQSIIQYKQHNEQSLSSDSLRISNTDIRTTVDSDSVRYMSSNQTHPSNANIYDEPLYDYGDGNDFIYANMETTDVCHKTYTNTTNNTIVSTRPAHTSTPQYTTGIVMTEKVAVNEYEQANMNANRSAERYLESKRNEEITRANMDSAIQSSEIRFRECETLETNAMYAMLALYTAVSPRSTLCDQCDIHTLPYDAYIQIMQHMKYAGIRTENMDAIVLRWIHCSYA